MTVPLHLGAMHPIEQALTLVLAFGPFVVLAVVVLLRRRADEREARAAEAADAEAADAEVADADRADVPDPT